MGFLSFIASIPGRLLAVLLGVTVLPLRSFSFLIQTSVLIALASIAFIIGTPDFNE